MSSRIAHVRKAVARAGGLAAAALEAEPGSRTSKMRAAKHEKRRQKILARLPHLADDPDELERRCEMLRLSELEAMRAKALQARTDARAAAERAQQAEAEIAAETG